MPIHVIFDALAACASLGMTLFVYRWRLRDAGQKIDSAGPLYALALLAGAAAGGFGAGTLNLWLSGEPGMGRSILGALAGAILAVEIFKRWRGITGSTGLIFVPAFATSVVVGRWGCYLSGLADETYGTPTSFPLGHDFGDGILRHPVQLYESFTMAVFLVVALILIGRRSAYFMRNGFYLLVLVYAGQRFLWEFLKPYGTVVGPFNLFHLLCAGLVIYSIAMMAKGRAS
ncbi:prolipoprotein diacylglyceryl transferase family protein [Aestuariivirga sp.]|uniref:prolipoprotein diacylglyceryl transferase family protein n=1 Tax=Aestuariivirga sp. TaxID=2650926 RepID=UPI003BA892EB